MRGLTTRSYIILRRQKRNNLQSLSEKTETEQLAEFNTFNDNKVGGEAQAKYKKIRYHMIDNV
jgi:hypothetical protein